MATNAIFLSASVPDPSHAPGFAKTADPVAISAAVSALVHVTLGRRVLVLGGHPSITPMIAVVAEGLGVDYGRWVQLYQSQYFKDDFPEENLRFKNVTYVEAIERNLERSLRAMRTRMFKDHKFDAAVFVGGMGGIFEEFELLSKIQPKTRMIPVFSTGGAVLELRKRRETTPDLDDELDYVALFHRQLNISVKENRYAIPEKQPSEISNRIYTFKPVRKSPRYWLHSRSVHFAAAAIVKVTFRFVSSIELLFDRLTRFLRR